MSLQKIRNVGAVFFLKENHHDGSYLGKVHLSSVPAKAFGEFQVVFRGNTFKFSLGVNMKGFDVSSHMPVWLSSGSPVSQNMHKRLLTSGVSCKLSAI